MISEGMQGDNVFMLGTSRCWTFSCFGIRRKATAGLRWSRRSKHFGGFGGCSRQLKNVVKLGVLVLAVLAVRRLPRRWRGWRFWRPTVLRQCRRIGNLGIGNTWNPGAPQEVTQWSRDMSACKQCASEGLFQVLEVLCLGYASGSQVGHALLSTWPLHWSTKQQSHKYQHQYSNILGRLMHRNLKTNKKHKNVVNQNLMFTKHDPSGRLITMSHQAGPYFGKMKLGGSRPLLNNIWD